MKHHHIPLSAAVLAVAHLIDARIGLRGALDSTESLHDNRLARLPSALHDAIALVDTCLRHFNDVALEDAADGSEAARRVVESGAWTCRACGYVGFWEGIHCGPGSEQYAKQWDAARALP